MVFKIKIPIFVYFKIKETMGLNTKFFDNIENKKFYILKCLKTDKEFIVSDARIPNEISEHIKNVLGITIPTNFEKKKFLLRTGKNWYYQFFHDPIPYSLPEHITCKICNTWKSFDLNNKSGAYTNHVLSHGETLESYLSKYPEESKYFNKHNLNKIREEEFNKDENFIECLECGKKFKTLSNTHMKHKHNMTLDEYKEKHNVYSITSNNYVNKFSKPQWEKTLKYKGFTKISKIEKEVMSLLDENNISYISGDRSLLDGLEIDILIENKKIGVEFNGLRYHSEKYGNKNRQYHIKKTKSMKKLGYRLIHIFEDESLYKKELVFDKLKHIIGINNKIKIWARKTVIRDISIQECNVFLNRNHIQGSVVRAKKIYGSFYNGKLVAVMAFDDNRAMTRNNHRWELTRFCTDIDYNVVGVGGKLFKHFLKLNGEIKEIISFADLRWTDVDNNIYEKLSFMKDGFTPPNYYYLNGKISRHRRLSKFNYSLTQLKKKGMYIKGMSEWECMQHHGFDRIWDCGLIRYVYKRKEVE